MWVCCLFEHVILDTFHHAAVTQGRMLTSEQKGAWINSRHCVTGGKFILSATINRWSADVYNYVLKLFLVSQVEGFVMRQRASVIFPLVSGAFEKTVSLSNQVEAEELVELLKLHDSVYEQADSWFTSLKDNMKSQILSHFGHFPSKDPDPQVSRHTLTAYTMFNIDVKRNTLRNQMPDYVTIR